MEKSIWKKPGNSVHLPEAGNIFIENVDMASGQRAFAVISVVFMHYSILNGLKTVVCHKPKIRAESARISQKKMRCFRVIRFPSWETQTSYGPIEGTAGTCRALSFVPCNTH